MCLGKRLNVVQHMRLVNKSDSTKAEQGCLSHSTNSSGKDTVFHIMLTHIYVSITSENPGLFYIHLVTKPCLRI